MVQYKFLATKSLTPQPLGPIKNCAYDIQDDGDSETYPFLRLFGIDFS
jgi:hypothetical protein